MKNVQLDVRTCHGQLVISTCRIGNGVYSTPVTFSGRLRLEILDSRTKPYQSYNNVHRVIFLGRSIFPIPRKSTLRRPCGRGSGDPLNSVKRLRSPCGLCTGGMNMFIWNIQGPRRWKCSARTKTIPASDSASVSTLGYRSAKRYNSKNITG